jgi:integral membrane sensor domain MASE1
MSSRRGRPFLGGGIDGNERLTAVAGVLLLVLFAVIGVTIIRIGQLPWLHLFLGLLLIGPVALKLASTGYRFARYYLATAAYRLNGLSI